MKLPISIKRVLAWLDWSTYCHDDTYSLPKSECGLAWKTLLSLSIAIISWPGHAWNLVMNIRLKNFSKRTSGGFKVTGLGGLCIHWAIWSVGHFVCMFTSAVMDWDWLGIHSDDWLNSISNYLALIGMGGIGISVLVVIVLSIMYIFNVMDDLKQKLGDIRLRDNNTLPNSGGSRLAIFKEKYCKVMDWSDI